MIKSKEDEYSKKLKEKAKKVPIVFWKKTNN